jgi:hypothetical protein
LNQVIQKLFSAALLRVKRTAIGDSILSSELWDDLNDKEVGCNLRYAGNVIYDIHEVGGKYDDSDIGPASVHRTIVRYRGSIGVHSAIDKGTTFFFTLDIVSLNE